MSNAYSRLVGDEFEFQGITVSHDGAEIKLETGPGPNPRQRRSSWTITRDEAQTLLEDLAMALRKVV